MKKQITIGIIMQSPDIGGAETYMLSLASDWMAKNNRVIVASNSGKFLKSAKKIATNSYEIPFLLDIMGNLRGLVKSLLLLPYATVYYVSLLHEFKKEGVSVIFMSNFTEKLLVSFLSQFVHIPVVWMEYGRLEKVFQKNFFLPQVAYRFLKDIPCRIIVPSKNTYDSLVSSAKVMKSKLVLIPLGVPTQVLHKKIIKPIRSNWKKSFIIGNVSRLTEEKGQRLLLQAMPNVIEQVPHARLLLIGDGPSKNIYENEIKRLGLTTKVVLKGFVKELDYYYDYMDIFVFPTIWELEGFGLVTIEAMAHKLPVIGSSFPPVPEIIDEGKTGLLIDVKNTEQLANAIITLAKNGKMREQLGENGYKKFIKTYTLDISSSKILSLLYEAAQSN